ncbi:serine hydrolase [Arthrobacter pigmenti]
MDDPLAEQKTIGDARSVGGPIRWNPDGSKLLAIGNLEPGVSISRLIEADVGTGFTRVLTDDVDLNVMPGATAYPGGAPRYVGDDRQVIFCLRMGGQTKLCSIDTFSGLLRQYELAEDQVVAGLAVAPRGDRAVVVLGDSQYFGELVAVDLDSGESTMLTHFQQSDLPDVALIPRRARQFEISDGTVVHGWIQRDPKTTGAGPLLLDVHGGPHNAWTGAADAVHLYHHVLAAKGWTILTLNPRGSDGYGNDFLTAVVGGWGVTDENDFLEPIDELIADGLVDSTALAVTGYSYGGFATCYLTARTRRFAAAIAGGLVCDLPAMAASSDEGEEMDKVEFGVSRERLWELSPLANAATVDTPTLVMHGEADVRCPVEQAEHWFASLRSAGTAARMVTYPGSSHLFVLTGRPSHRSDYNRRLIDWAERFVVGTGVRGASAQPAPPDRKYWQRKLRQSAARFHVPGAQLGFIELDQDGNTLTETVVTAGVVNNVSREAVSGDSLFEIGSITKIWTTVLIMQLVEEGRLDLDSPVRDVLPDLILADDQVASTVTTRDLLCHRSGIDGDVFTPTSKNDDAVRRYVELLGSATQVHPRGNGFSYCNSGFVIAGRIVEVLRGEPWDHVVRDRLIHTLRLAHTLTGPDPSASYSTAVGHIDHNGVWEPAVDGAMPRSVGPAANVIASAHDVLVFASIFLRKGVGSDGTSIMSPESVDTMRTQHVDLPARTGTVSGWGAGWMLENWAGVDVYGHNGATVGQNAFLRVFPEERIAVVLLTNGGMPTGMYRELFSDVTSTIAGVEPPHWFEPPVDEQPHTDLAPYVGTYCSGGTDVEISLCDSKLIAIITSKLGLTDETDLPETWTLHPVRPHVFAGRQRLGEEWGELRFLADDEGNEYLQFGLRRIPKLAN